MPGVDDSPHQYYPKYDNFYSIILKFNWKAFSGKFIISLLAVQENTPFLDNKIHTV